MQTTPSRIITADYENSQPYGDANYVTDGSGGPGPNTNGEVVDRNDLTGLSALMSGSKMGPYKPKGNGLTWTEIAAGIKLTEKIAKQFGDHEEQEPSNSEGPENISKPDRSFSYSYDTVYHTTDNGDTSSVSLYPAMIDESGNKSRIAIQPKDTAEFNKAIRKMNN